MISCLIVSSKPYLIDALSAIDFINDQLKLVSATELQPGFDLVITDIKLTGYASHLHLIEVLERPIVLSKLIQEIESYISSTSKQLTFADITLETVARELVCGAKSVQLTELECKILAALISSKSNLLSREEIKTSVLGYSEDVKTSTIENHIYHLRQKLTASGSNLKIEKLDGGYTLIS